MRAALKVFYYVGPQCQRYMLVVWQQRGILKKMATGMEMWMKQRCVIEFLSAEKITPTDIHQCLLNVTEDQIEDVGTVKWCLFFS